MNAITIVLRSGMGMKVDAVRPYLKPGMPIAIGRAGAVIAEVAEGNAIEDKRKAAESAGGYIDSVERYMESASNLESVVTGLESALICIESCAINWQSEPLAALRRIREITTAFLESSGGRAQQDSPALGSAADPLGLADRVREFNGMHTGVLKPGIFDVITGTANLPPQAAQELPTPEEHAAQIEQVAAGLREDQAELAKSILVLGDWLERVEIEDGYVGVPVIEAVEVVVTELKRQQKTADPVVCRYGHWFAGDSDEATLIRERGICSDCAAVDDSWLGAQEPEGGEA